MGENFVIAWEKLKFRHENKRVSIGKHLDDILKIQPLLYKSAKALNNLICPVNETLGPLKTLGAPIITYWDHIIIYIIVNRLDAENYEVWEIYQGASVEPP